MNTLVNYVGLIIFSIIGSTLTGAGISEKITRSTKGGYYWFGIIMGAILFLMSFGLAFKI